MTSVFTYQLYDDSMMQMQDILKLFRYGFRTIGDLKVEGISDRSREPETVVLEYMLAGGTTVTIRPSDDVQTLEVCVTTASDDDRSEDLEARIRKDIENIIYMGHGMSYCCE